jgi:hypothetical protein
MSEIVGIGNAFEFASVASPSTYSTLAGVTSFNRSGDKVSMEKTTTMATANGVDTFKSSTQDPGSFDVKGDWYPGDTTQIALEAIRAAGTAVSMKGLYGTSNSVSFTGIVESFTPSFPLEKIATFDLKIKISGPVVYA